MLQGSYFEIVSQSWQSEPKSPSWRKRLRMAWESVINDPGSRPPYMGRLMTVCKPFEGKNAMHVYRPPFGLCRYDERFRQNVA
jgi:hypothetical protein